MIHTTVPWRAYGANPHATRPLCTFTSFPLGGGLQPQAPFARQSCICTGIVAECAQTMHTAATATTGALDDLARVSASSRRLTWSGKAADMFHARMRQFDTTIAGHLDCRATTGAMLKAGLP